MFRSVLIANRGEIALRIIRTLREMGLESIAAYSDADRDAPFVWEADRAYRLGPPPAGESYLSVDALLAVARQSGAEAIHPGYGFLAENPNFARAVAEAGMTFIGPSPDAMRLMGDKVEARRTVGALGVPLVPGTSGPVRDLHEARAFGEFAGYPVAVKAAGGGGGRGIRVVQGPDEMENALEGARREALTYFKNPEVYLERYFADPRHIEIQVLGDTQGSLVHLGERDCSVQRRHQKLIEETPSPAVGRELRGRLGEAALRAASSVQYTSAGTVEFLLTREDEFYFLEMNTRIQVEHPVTEQVTGIDLIREMVSIAAGERLSLPQSVLDPYGHSIEVRINAEDPAAGFRPTPVRIRRYYPAGGIGIRVDSGVDVGFTIPQNYDSMMAKLIVWGPDREHARLRMLRALGEFQVEGPASTIPFARAVLSDPIFASGDVGTTFVEQNLDRLLESVPPYAVQDDLTSGGRGEERRFDVEVNRRRFEVKIAELDRPDESPRPARPRSRSAATPKGTELVSPMHGTVVSVLKSEGDTVQQGDTVIVVEAMKMENEIAAHRAGTVTSLGVATGDTVETGQVVAAIG